MDEEQKKRKEYLIGQRKETLEMKREEFRIAIANQDVGADINANTIDNLGTYLCRLSTDMAKIEGQIYELSIMY